MTDPKISVEEASKMSLDEYINASGITDSTRKNGRNYKRRNNHAVPMEYDDTIPSASSQQWRLNDPNRPRGMPPLVPSTARKNYHKHNYNYNHRRQHQKSWADRDAPSNVNGINRNNQTNFKPQTRHNSIFQAALRKTVSSTNANNGLSTSLVPLKHANNAIATLDNFSQGLALVAPLLAKTPDYMNMFNMMMEKWDPNRQRNEPKYDMKMQREISEIQGKPLFFTGAPGGGQSVVSFDGPGVDDCTVKVNSTDTSMNQRFA